MINIDYQAFIKILYLFFKRQLIFIQFLILLICIDDIPNIFSFNADTIISCNMSSSYFQSVNNLEISVSIFRDGNSHQASDISDTKMKIAGSFKL